MIECRSLSFSYGKNEILHDLSLTFEPGVLYGVIGPNGCGKTTLIRLLCGLETPDRGSLRLNARPYCAYNRKELARQISLLPQARSLPSVSAWELVARGRYPYLGWTGRLCEKDRAAVDNALHKAGVEALADRDVTCLSGGERQRVCLALLFAQDTPYVLLDEPTTYLDVSHRFSLLSRMCELRNEGKCVVCVLHDLPLALRYCDRLIVMENGRLRACDTPKNLVACGILEEVFSVRCRTVEVDGETEYLFSPKCPDSSN